MKIVRLTWRPASYVQPLYQSAPGAENLPYDQQKAWLFSDFWGTADGWAHALAQLGYDASDHIVNIPALSAAWYRSVDRAPSASGFAVDLISHLKPDVLVLEGVERFTLSQVKQLRSALSPGARIAGVSGFEIDEAGALQGLDVFFTCRPDLAASLFAKGMHAYHLPHAFDARINDVLGAGDEHALPFGFIGSILPGGRMHDTRRLVIERLAKRFDFPIYSPAEKSPVRAAGRYVFRAAAKAGGSRLLKSGVSLPDHTLVQRLKTAGAWAEVPKFEYIPGLSPRMRAPVFGLEMYRTLRSFATTVNVQPGISNLHATNVRLFEATGVGTCLLTDRSVDIAEYFSDDEVVTFGSADEAVEKAVYLVDNPQIARAIGAAGQRRTLADHTYQNRMELVAGTLATGLNNVRMARSS